MYRINSPAYPPNPPRASPPNPRASPPRSEAGNPAGHPALRQHAAGRPSLLRIGAIACQTHTAVAGGGGVGWGVGKWVARGVTIMQQRGRVQVWSFAIDRRITCAGLVPGSPKSTRRESVPSTPAASPLNPGRVPSKPGSDPRPSVETPAADAAPGTVARPPHPTEPGGCASLLYPAEPARVAPSRDGGTPPNYRTNFGRGGM
ncbi:hypothetical protein T492DRAFT_851145, partial [Pavlovales sp. CCMP2436]